MSKRYKNYNGKNRNRQEDNVVADVQGVELDEEELEETEAVDEEEEEDEEEVEETRPKPRKKSKKAKRRREDDEEDEDEGIITPKGKKLLLGVLFGGLAIGGGLIASKISHDHGRKKGFSEGYAAGYTDGKPKPIEQQPIDTTAKFVDEEVETE